MSIAFVSHIEPLVISFCTMKYTPLYMNMPGTMMTMEGTVRVILGQPIFFLIADAMSPAERAPINAAAPAGSSARSISSSRRVFAIMPIMPAVTAILRVLLNMRENPYTPQKLVISLNAINSGSSISSAAKSPGSNLNTDAAAQPVTVAMNIISRAYVTRSSPERISSFDRSIPPVISGNPGMTNSIEHM